MLEKIKAILSFYLTPIIAAVIYLLVNNFLHDQGAYQLSAIIGIILGIAMVISTFINHSDYGKVMKWLCPVLCAVVLISAFSSFDTDGNSSGAGQISFGSSYKRCDYCQGGQVNCGSSYCSHGRCTRCGGDGIYSHGSYSSRCSVCSGDGFCNRCGGDGKVDCAVCKGTGKRPK